MKTTLLVIQVILAVLLSASILVQQRGTGLSATFGGSGGFYVAKRGAERVLVYVTIVLAVLFVANVLAFLFI